MKTYVDAIVIIPLEEEFEQALKFFDFQSDVSSDSQIRFLAKPAGGEALVLLVKQDAMGRTSAQEAISEAANDFDTGLIVCLGIAGGLSSDVNIGDVCYSGSIIDVLDNAKAYIDPDKVEDLAFSPTNYVTPRNISIAINLDRIGPDTKDRYDAWRNDRERVARDLIPGQFFGKGKKLESISRPTAKDGTIACAAVSASPKYNARLKAIDRKILAVETESGGIFSVAKRLGIPAITVRGISDYADTDKTKFEEETNFKAREIAAANASSFLAMEFGGQRLIKLFETNRADRAAHQSSLPLVAPATEDAVEVALRSQGEAFDEKLRALAPSYLLLARGYRLPIPRIRIFEGRTGIATAKSSEPVDIRDAIRDSRVLVLHVPKEYPDLSLAWIIATDLLTAQVGEHQIVPTVIDAARIQRPRFGIKELADDCVLATGASPHARRVFVVNAFDFDSKTKAEFLRDQITDLSDDIFIIITKTGPNLLLENSFTTETLATVGRVCDVSFVEIAYFLQKNFEMAGPASEVVATRLRETFQNFDLPAHPTYFAGIPRNVIDGLLQANRRAELIELAVVGYLSFVVAGDAEPIALSRKTREKFLSALSYDMNVEKITFTEGELTLYTEKFANKYDFKISSAKFIGNFIEKGILHVESERIAFSLPFMESYLLAKVLHERPEKADKFFAIGEADFDFPTFTLYAEMGASEGFIKALTVQLDESIAVLTSREKPSVLVGDALSPQLLQRQDRLQEIRQSLVKATAEVRSDQGAALEKQKLLDAADRVRESAARRSKAALEDAEAEDRITVERSALFAWFTCINLLGSGAERLEAATKRELVAKVIRLSSLIVEDWTRVQQKIDFEALKEELLADEEFLRSLARSEKKNDVADAKRTIEGLVDALEFIFLGEPLRRIIGSLCEEARDNVLAESIANVVPDNQIDDLIHSIWLSDVDTPRGRAGLMKAIKQLPKARFLRVNLAQHLIERVYWKHWKKEDRLSLLDAADESLKVIGRQYDKSELKRLIERGKKDEGE